MRYADAHLRRDEVQRILGDEAYVSSADLAERIGVSEMTIRRDLRMLEADGRARRVAGGATSAIDSGIPFERRDVAATAQKRAIAAIAAEEVAGFATVAVDAGTTAAAVAPLLRAQTIVTHSLPVIASLAGRRPHALIAAGGHYQPETRSFAGPLAEATLQGIRCDATILSATAVTADALWGTNAPDAAIKRILAGAAVTVVVVADGGKLGAAAPLRILDTAAVDVLVTDGTADPEVVATIVDRGVRVRIA